MNHPFDELAKGLARSVTRRGALKRFGFGLAGITLAALGLADKAHADPRKLHCHCKKPYYGCDPLDSTCIGLCYGRCAFGR